MKINWTLEPHGSLIGPLYHDGLFLGILADKSSRCRCRYEFYSVEDLSERILLDFSEGRNHGVEDSRRELQRHGSKYLFEITCCYGATAYITFNHLEIELIESES